jgi:hypothetical protein
MAGVVERPTLTQAAPAAPSPASVAGSSSGAVTRGSWPTATCAGACTTHVQRCVSISDEHTAAASATECCWRAVSRKLCCRRRACARFQPTSGQQDNTVYPGKSVARYRSHMRAMRTLTPLPVLPSPRCPSQRANAPAMKNAAPGVSVTASLGDTAAGQYVGLWASEPPVSVPVCIIAATPGLWGRSDQHPASPAIWLLHSLASATPRTSLPFCKRLNDAALSTGAVAAGMAPLPPPAADGR